MARSECPDPNKEGCPWQFREGGCFADTDHIIPRFVGRQQPTRAMRRLARLFIVLPENKQQLCRYEHDQKCHEEMVAPPELPPADEMRRAIVAHALGQSTIDAVAQA